MSRSVHEILRKVGMRTDVLIAEDWGEDHILTSHMGVAYASGLSKNSSWGESDAVVPVMKHFAAHGAPQGGLNAAPWMGHGNREVLQNLLVPFKAAVELGGARGVMMAYSELNDVPSHVNPMLYDALEEWGYDGFVIADDTGTFHILYAVIRADRSYRHVRTAAGPQSRFVSCGCNCTVVQCWWHDLVLRLPTGHLPQCKSFASMLNWG